MNIIALDWETYYGKDFTLSGKKWNTSSYIRNEQFKVHGVGIKINKLKTKWYSTDAAIRKALSGIDWADSALLAHNTAFDGAILAWHYGIIPKFYYDTMSMTRGLHNEVSRASLGVISQLYGLGGKIEGTLESTKDKRTLTKDEAAALGAYCIQDVELCYALFEKQKAIYPQSELELIDLTLRMFIQPQLVVNEGVAEKALAEEWAERNWLILASGAPEECLTSNDKFVLELEKLNVDVPTKLNPKGLEAPALAQNDEGFLELLEHDDRRVVRLAAGRLAAKSTLFETRGRRLINDGTRGSRLPVLLNYFGAKTGRWSGGNKTNMQNLPRLERDSQKNIIEKGAGMLRLAIEAPRGHRIVVADSSQIEARTIAWLAGQQNVVDLFAAKEDVYSHMARTIYRKEEVSKTERFVGKVAVLGLGYGMGPNKFQTTLAVGMMGPPVEMPLVEAKGVVNTFRNTNSKIVQLWRRADAILNDMVLGKNGHLDIDGERILEWEDTTVWLPNGMGLHYPELECTENGFSYMSHQKRKKIYGGLLVENIVQALARIIVSDQMLAFNKELELNTRLRLKSNEVAQIVLMTHDEIVSVVPERLADATTYIVLQAMCKAPKWASGVPLDAEGGHALRYEK